MKLVSISFFIVALVSCVNSKLDHHKQSSRIAPSNKYSEHIITEDYELFIPEKQNALLVLFPCMPCDAENTKTEFKITEVAAENGISLMLINFNQRLWLTDSEKNSLETLILEATEIYNVKTDHLYIGGFSSGGNVSMLLTDHLKTSGSELKPEGVFIVDSPIDLYALKRSALQTIKRNFSPPAVAEANWILDMSRREFGEGDSALVHYEMKSPYSSRTKSNQNISNLEGVKVRLYTEPDTLWWMEEKQAEYENMNAFYIEQLAEDLKTLYGSDPIELIKTKNRGYRANGMRHPHSWSIVNEEELVKWVFK